MATLRAFALHDPNAFALVFAPTTDGAALDPELLEAAVTPVVAVVGELVGPEHALDAARTITAWASGFLRMELADALATTRA